MRPHRRAFPLRRGCFLLRSWPKPWRWLPSSRSTSLGPFGVDDPEWGAVWFVAVVMGLWCAGLVVVSRGVVAGRRWAFTPILFTQGLFGIAAITFFGAAAPMTRVVWGLVVVVAVVVLRLLFSREVRQHLIYDNS